MNACPHCGEKTIGTWKKSSASDLLPAVCPNCGGRSFVSSWAHAVFALLSEAFLWGSIISAIVLRSWWPLVLFPVAWVALLVHTYRRWALRKIDEQEVRRMRRRAIIQGVVFVLAAVALSVMAG